MTGSGHQPQGIPISECGLDDFTLKLLQLSRVYFTAYAEGEAPDGKLAAAICKRDFGHRYSVEIAMSLLCVLGAMRESRKSTFKFNSTTCQKCRYRISDCERLLFLTIKASRDGNKSEAWVFAMMLCEGNDAMPLIKAVERLNHFMNKIKFEPKNISP
ncbi:MAG: hypothetical protein AAF423_03185 [Pseudomonadota bacterium]